MIVTDLLPMLQSLSRADKLRAIEFLASELAKEEEAAQQKPSFSSVTLYNSFEAAHKLAKFLEENKEEDTHLATFESCDRASIHSKI